MRGGRRAAWQHEGFQRPQGAVHPVDLGLEPRHLLLRHREPRRDGGGLTAGVASSAPRSKSSF